MAATWSDLKAYYDNVRLQQLTNTNTPGATSINDTVGLKAETAAIAMFKRVVGITYDATNADYETVLFDVIIFILEKWGNTLGENYKERKKQIEDDLFSLQQVTARKRVTPVGSSALDPNDDTRDNAIVDPKPDFDLSRFDGITPNQPAGGNGATFPNPFPS